MAKIEIPVSVIIPTYMEERRLPKLLESIKMQFVQPKEIIVADNFSTDRTREIAREYGVKIVDGGNVARGRNNGAKYATTDLLIFMDADVILPDEFSLMEMFIEFKRSGADVASTLFDLDEESKRKIVQNVSFSVYKLLKKSIRITKKPVVESGFTMMCRRDVFEKLNGFDETFNQAAEDLDFSRRAIKAGYRYAVLDVKVLTSGRRYKNISKALTSVIGAAGAGILIVLGYRNRGKILKIFQNLYGELGGARDKDK